MLNCTEPTGCIKDKCMYYDTLFIVTKYERNKEGVVCKIFNGDNDALFEFYETLKADRFRPGDSKFIMQRDGITYVAKYYDVCLDSGDIEELV